MNLTCILVDCGTVKPAAAELKQIRGAGYRVRIFHGPHQNKFDADIVQVSSRDRPSWQCYHLIIETAEGNLAAGDRRCVRGPLRHGESGGKWEVNAVLQDLIRMACTRMRISRRAGAGFDPGSATLAPERITAPTSPLEG